MALTPIDHLPIDGKHVFIRVDFNVPLHKDGTVSDDTRIREALPTIRYALARGAKVLLASHLGRPQGKVDPAFSLRPAAERLATLLGTAVKLAPDCIGPAVREQVAALLAGEVLVLENLRFHAEEEKNEPSFARALAALAEVYVNDAFGSSHRAHASVVGMVQYFASKGIGFLMRKEIDALSRLLANPERPFVAILGGAKVSDKIGLIRSLLARVDTIIIGGAMAYTLQKAQGVATGKSLVEADKLAEVTAILAEAARRGVTLLLPKDHIVAAELKAGVPFATTPGREIPDDQLGVDIGPQSIQAFAAAVQPARTILWNGPMGVFENDAYARGTLSIAHAVSNAYALTVVGGGETALAVHRAGESENMSFISTGGGATLELLEGKELPGLAALPTRPA